VYRKVEEDEQEKKPAEVEMEERGRDSLSQLREDSSVNSDQLDEAKSATKKVVRDNAQYIWYAL